MCGQRRSDKKHIYNKGSTLTELREMGSPEFFSFCFLLQEKANPNWFYGAEKIASCNLCLIDYTQSSIRNDIIAMF